MFPSKRRGVQLRGLGFRGLRCRIYLNPKIRTTVVSLILVRGLGAGLNFLFGVQVAFKVHCLEGDLCFAHCNMGVYQNYGYHFGGPINKDYGIWGSILGSPYFGKLPPKKKGSLMFGSTFSEVWGT